MNGTVLQGFALMLTGISTVLLFLSVLILAIFLMSKVMKKFNSICPEADSAAGQKEDHGKIAAILAMIMKKK